MSNSSRFAALPSMEICALAWGRRMKKSQLVSTRRSQKMLVSPHLEDLFQMGFYSSGVFFMQMLKKT